MLYAFFFIFFQCIKNWSHDNYFGAQRLVGTNPNQIRLCTELPEK